MEIALIFVWLLFGTLSAIVAPKKGRNVYGWAIAGFLFGPLALVVVGLMDSKKAKTVLPSSNVPAVQPATSLPTEHIPCPYCAELIMPTARICRFCYQDLVSAPSSRAAEQDPNNKWAMEKASADNDTIAHLPLSQRANYLEWPSEATGDYRCSTCKTLNEPYAVFCRNCGQWMPFGNGCPSQSHPPYIQKACLRCGAINVETNIYCKSCNTPI